MEAEVTGSRRSPGDAGELCAAPAGRSQEGSQKAFEEEEGGDSEAAEEGPRWFGRRWVGAFGGVPLGIAFLGALSGRDREQRGRAGRGGPLGRRRAWQSSLSTFCSCPGPQLSRPYWSTLQCSLWNSTWAVDPTCGRGACLVPQCAWWIPQVCSVEKSKVPVQKPLGPHTRGEVL